MPTLLKRIEVAVDSAISNSKRPSEMGVLAAAIVAREVVGELGRLEARLAELEREALCFAGSFDIARSYDRNDLCQRGGSLYLALVETLAGDMPGASPNWRRIAESRA